MTKTLNERIDSLTMMDDVFMTAVLDDNIPGTELILRIILGIPSLTVVEQTVQRTLKNLKGRSSILDVHAIDADGKQYDIEVQNDNSGAHPRRARYNASMMDAHALSAGEETDLLPESYVIFITRNDIFGKGSDLYHFERALLGDGTLFGDGSHIIYVNCASEDTGSALSALIHDMLCSEPDKMNHVELAQRARLLKSEKGSQRMGKMLEDLLHEAEKEAAERGMTRGMAEGREIGLAMGKELGIIEGKELGIAEGKELGIAEGKELGIAEGKDAGRLEAQAESVRSLAASMDIEIEEALNLLNISGCQRERLISTL